MNKMTKVSSKLRRLMPAALITLLVLIIAGVPLLAREEAPTAPDQDPDFSQVDDPLNGELQLFTVDDLLIARTKPENSKTQSQINNYILETANETISKQSLRTVATPDCYIVKDNLQPGVQLARQPQQTRIGRFFNLPYDVIVTLLPSEQASGQDCTAGSGEDNMALNVQDIKTSDSIDATFSLADTSTAVALEDFTLDGFDDLFILTNDEALAATAVDINDKSKGLKFGSTVALGSLPGAVGNPITGDFNHDGLRDAAWYGGGNVHFATVCPGSVEDTICENKNTLDVILNSNPLAHSNMVAITSGNYSSYEGTGLLVITSPPFNADDPTRFDAYWYQFDNNWDPIGGQEISSLQFFSSSIVDVADHAMAVSAKLDWLGGTDQAIVAVQGEIFGAGGNTDSVVLDLTVLTFDAATNKMTGHSTGLFDEHNTGFLSPSNPPWLNGLAVGRFAAIGDNPDDTDFNLQIAVLRNDKKIHFFSVDPSSNDYKPASLSTVAIDSSLGLNNMPTVGFLGNPEPYPRNWLSAGDLQGRSARLGGPTVIRMSSHSQPSVILGAPPMHVDYILPDQSTASEWQVVNFSAVPDTYNSSYSMSETSSNQSSDTSTTSYTYATTEQAGGKFKIKVPVVGSIGGSITKTAENKNEDVKSDYSFVQNEFKYDASTTTGFGDEIWYDQSSFNIYLYPVIGQTICPADEPSCSAGEEEQLYIMYSGPNSSGTGPGPGAATEWYQPIHEPGNIFSYPWSETMLAQQITGGIDLLTSPQHFYTDDSTQAQNLSWSESQQEAQTAGTTNTQSYETNYSLTGGKQIGEAVDLNLSGNLDYNESTAISNLNKSSSSIGASQGVTIEKPGTFQTFGLYQYRVEPYIFGRVPSAGHVDKLTHSEDISTVGPLQAAYTVDPLDSQAGSWWVSDDSPYQQHIDVALNHPMRWQLDDPTGSQTTLNCLSAGGARDNCMEINQPNAADLWNSQFYWMRGLLVTVGGVDGPQRFQATEGDEVTLQARVYNYSFKDMSSESKIKVRFYRQQINGTTPTGDSVLIAEKTIDSLPGFNSQNSPQTANWTTATTDFDTSGLGDSYHIFWVVVWAEDGSGDLVPELQGHGLSAKPGTLTAVGDVPLEMVTLDGERMTFSNNVGYLHSKFYIAKESPSPNASVSDPQLEIVGAKATPSTVQPGERVIISAHIYSQGAAADGIHVQFFPSEAEWRAHQDDPLLPPPRPFDVELLPHIGKGRTDRLEVPYRAIDCGQQEVLIVAQAGATGEQATATASYSNGPCQAYSPVVALGTAVK